MSLTISSGEQIALVGANGVGKTTLLRIVGGEEEADRGSAQLANGWTIAGITTWQSGPNLQSLYATNFNLGGVSGGTTVSSNLWLGTPDIRLQPIVTCDPTKGLGKNQFINGACFAVPSRPV